MAILCTIANGTTKRAISAGERAALLGARSSHFYRGQFVAETQGGGLFDLQVLKNVVRGLFYVAFSSGKDSLVMPDLIQRALPHDSFEVIFGDRYSFTITNANYS